jgi:hypothetical protein
MGAPCECGGLIQSIDSSSQLPEPVIRRKSIHGLPASLQDISPVFVNQVDGVHRTQRDLDCHDFTTIAPSSFDLMSTPFADASQLKRRVCVSWSAPVHSALSPRHPDAAPER